MATKIVIPESKPELDELLGDKPKVGELIENGQFGEVVEAYALVTDKRGELAAQVADQIKATLTSEEVIEGHIEASTEKHFKRLLTDHGVSRPNVMPDPGTGAEVNARYNALAPGTAMNEVGFLNLGDFARNIWHKNPRPDTERLSAALKVMNDYSSVDPAAGGFLIPEEQRSEIMQLALEESFVRSRATVITMTSLTQLMPYVDWTTNVGSVFGGMVFYWTQEAGDITITNAKFGRVKLEASKLTGAAAVPNELWADAPALSSWLMQAIPRGIAFTEDDAFLNGNGTDQPLGVLNSGNGALVTVAKEAGQTASSIYTENILKMFSQMLPSSLDRAVWVVNQTTFTELMTLSLPVGTGGFGVGLVDIRSEPFRTMLGRPLIITEKVPALGSKSDVNFIDFGYYLIGDRQSISMETSEHARFLSDETLLRIIERVDGRPWMQSAFTPKNGDDVSPFVTLAARP